jgi:hypothetical protein
MALSNDLVHRLDKKTTTGFPMPVFIGMVVAAIIVGVVTGYLLNRGKSGGTTVTTNSSGKTDDSAPNAVGVTDKSTFKDVAEGTLQEGGIEGEGSFHLVRPGGESQYVYLTSSTVDLSKFINKKIRVHGQTISGQKAGWLMDVGYVEVL